MAKGSRVSRSGGAGVSSGSSAGASRTGVCDGVVSGVAGRPDDAGVSVVAAGTGGSALRGVSTVFAGGVPVGGAAGLSDGVCGGVLVTPRPNNMFSRSCKLSIPSWLSGKYSRVVTVLDNVTPDPVLFWSSVVCAGLFKLKLSALGDGPIAHKLSLVTPRGNVLGISGSPALATASPGTN